MSFAPFLASCANPEDCLVQVADSVLMGPGTNAPTFYIQSDDGPKKVKDAHSKAEFNRAFAHFGRKRTKSIRVIAPVVPGTSTVATHVLMDLETTPVGSDTVNSVQLNITINGSPIEPNLVLHEVIPHLVGDKEELVMIFQPLTLQEGETLKATVVSISGDEIDAALANPDKITTIDTMGAPLQFADFTGRIKRIRIKKRGSYGSYRAAPSSGDSVTTNILSKEAAESILIIYASSKTGELVVGSLSKKAGGDYFHTALDLKLTRAPLTWIVETDDHGSDLFSTNASEAFFISRREVSPGVSALDVVTRSYASPLSDLSFEAATFDTGDFNGDGIADLYVSTNFSMLTASAMLSAEDVGCAGCLIYFGDGLGGFLETAMDVPGGPWREWNVDDGIQAHFGKGTKSSATSASAKPQLL